MVPKEVLSFIKENDRFFLTSHVNPDGDGLGSAMAMKWALNRLGKESVIVIDSKPPVVYQFFANYDWVRPIGPDTDELRKFDTAIIVDAPNIERVGKAAELLNKNAKILSIDHHVSSENFGAVNYLDGAAAATAEMICYVINALGLPIDAECAEYLYTGILIDTGRFRYSNTSPAVLQAACDLVAAGAKPHVIAEHLFYNNTRETTEALGLFLNSIELHLGGKVATAEFGNEILTSDYWKNVDTEGFVNHPLAIRGVEVAAFLREVEPEVTRVSLRSKHDFDVNELASEFGGGGHAKAAGLTINAPLVKAKRMLLGEAAKRMG